MQRTHNSVLEEIEGRFTDMGMNVAARVLTGVIDRFMDAAYQFVECPWMHRRFDGDGDFDMASDIGMHELARGVGLGVLGANHTKIAVTLSGSENYLFIAPRAPAPWLSANIGLIDLDRNAKTYLGRLQNCGTKVMAEVPRCFVADCELAIFLIRRHTLGRVPEQVDGKELLSKRKVSVGKNRSRNQAELIAASIAVELIALNDARNLVRFAGRDIDTFGPGEPLAVALLYAPRLLSQRAVV
jgi:hypothetical protein